MERWVAIVMMVIVIVIGFLVVQNIREGTNQIDGNVTQSLECRLAGAQCVGIGACEGEVLDHITCGEATVCCQT